MTHKWLLCRLRSVLCAGFGLILSGMAYGQSLPAWYVAMPEDPALISGRGKAVGDDYYIPVIEETLNEAMTRTRGVMKKKQKHFAEVASQWTVFAK